MPDKYSLRVELSEELERKLKRLSGKKSQSMTDWVRSQIVNTLDSAPDLEAFRTVNPRVLEKLIFWTKKRISQSSGYRFSISDQKDLEKEALKFIEDVVAEIIFAEDEVALLNKCRSIEKTLSHQEKACIGSFFPFNLNLEVDEKIDWFTNSDWYSLENGEYITLKEQVIESFNYEEQETGFVSINSYFADILNAPNMMIVDVDLIGESSRPTDPVITPYQSVAIAALKAFQHENPTLGFRVYKTAGGLRYICTTEMFDPNSHKSDSLMRQLFTDPKYRNLCKFQETYRARLTPKPWRLGINDEEDCKTCQMIEIVGPDSIIDNFRKMVKHHDWKTQALTGKDLILA